MAINGDQWRSMAINGDQWRSMADQWPINGDQWPINGRSMADQWPINGRSMKADLNLFLTSVKRSFPDLEYLWIAEFQTRGCPHFHFFSNIPLTDENHVTLTRKWHKIAGYGQDKHLRVNGHESKIAEIAETIASLFKVNDETPSYFVPLVRI